MANLTIPQRKALESAAKTGSAWNAWGNVYRTSTNRMMQALCARGLLTHDGRPTDKTADALGLPVAHGVTQVGAQVITAALPEPVDHPTLADCAAKFEDTPMYECEIPGAPGRITYGKDAQIVGRATRELPPGYFEGRLVSLEIDGEALSCGFALGGKVELREHQKAAVADVVDGFGSRLVWMKLDNPGYRAKPRRPKTYKPYTLGIDSFKVTDSARCNSLEDLRRLDAQDAKVCRIEQELLQYAGKRRTPHRDRKVAKLRKVLRILKRGLYE